MSTSTEFRRSVRPLILINSIFATGLLEYYDDYTSHVIGYIYAFLSIAVYCVFFYVIMYVIQHFMHNRPFMLQMTFHIHTYGHLVFHVCTILFGIIRKKETKYALTQIETFFRGMEKVGIPRNDSKYHRYLWYVLLGAFINLVGLWVVEFIWSGPSYNNYGKLIFTTSVEHYPFIVLSTGEISFIYWILYIKCKFGELNTVLRDMLTTTIDSPQHKRVLRMRNSRKDVSPSRDIYQAYQTNADLKKIKKIKQIHLELIKCARITNTTYSWHVLMSMTAASIFLTTLLYNVYNLLFEASFSEKFDFIGYGYWIAYLAIKVVVMSHVCATTVTEIREFTQQLLQNPLTFSVCGFFDLNNTYIRSVIGTVTTYLVILIQVGSAPLKFYRDNGTFPNAKF